LGSERCFHLFFQDITLNQALSAHWAGGCHKENTFECLNINHKQWTFSLAELAEVKTNVDLKIISPPLLLNRLLCQEISYLLFLYMYQKQALKNKAIGKEVLNPDFSGPHFTIFSPHHASRSSISWTSF